MSKSAAIEPQGLVEHFFRHEAGRLTARLVRRFGAHRLNDIEDAVQYAFERALGVWPRQGVPESPPAWLTQVAKNRLIDKVRKKKCETSLDEIEEANVDVVFITNQDDLLTLLFACSDDQLIPRARLVLCLKLVCGFSTQEIATRLFITPANVQKILERGRQRLQDSYKRTVTSRKSSDALKEQLYTVQHVLYLIFNEGYSLGEGDIGLRTELCDEAIRLTGLLAQNSLGDTSSTWALLALMHFHAMRLPARLDNNSRFIPLRKQDRSLWDRHHRRLGFTCMQEAIRDSQFSRFHGEAAVQIEHAMATSVETTRWGEIVSLYQTLMRMAPSPMYTLNHAIAQAEASCPQDGLNLLEQASLPSWFKKHHLFLAVLGDLHKRQGNKNKAVDYLQQALQKAPSTAEKHFLLEQINLCNKQ